MRKTNTCVSYLPIVQKQLFIAIVRLNFHKFGMFEQFYVHYNFFHKHMIVEANFSFIVSLMVGKLKLIT